MPLMTPDEYCLGVCKGKCCTLHLADEGAVPCPCLSPSDGSCTVYAERYKEGSADLVVVGYYKSKKYKDLQGEPATRPYFCGRIEQIIAAGGLPEAIKSQCCYAHPELLQKVYRPMKMEVRLEQGKMSERQVRDSIEKATANARKIESQKGNGDVSHEKIRADMIKNAERDNREGKI